MYLAIKWAKIMRKINHYRGWADELFAGYNFLVHKSEEVRIGDQ